MFTVSLCRGLWISIAPTVEMDDDVDNDDDNVVINIWKPSLNLSLLGFIPTQIQCKTERTLNAIMVI